MTGTRVPAYHSHPTKMYGRRRAILTAAMEINTSNTPDAAAFQDEDTKEWLEKFYTVNEEWVADDRRKLLAFARDLLNSDYAGHRLTFQLFAQSPPFAHLNAVYNNFDFSGPLDFVRNSAGLSDRVMGKKGNGKG